MGPFEVSEPFAHMQCNFQPIILQLFGDYDDMLNFNVPLTQWITPTPYYIPLIHTTSHVFL